MDIDQSCPFSHIAHKIRCPCQPHCNDIERFGLGAVGASAKDLRQKTDNSPPP